jgi:hypothetical protein
MEEQKAEKPQMKHQIQAATNPANLALGLPLPFPSVAIRGLIELPMHEFSLVEALIEARKAKAPTAPPTAEIAAQD